MQLTSIIIPVFNEDDNIHPVINKLKKELLFKFEIIFIDDGSTDNTLQEISSLSTKDKDIKCISLSRNFGHQNALMAGMSYAKGDYIITMDGDLQHPPSLIPEMISKLDQGFDIVHTCRIKTQNISFFKRVFAAIFYKLINFISDIKIEPNTSDFRAFNKKVLNAVLQFEERELFLRGIFTWIGFNSMVMNFEAPERINGLSKYTFGKMMLLALKGITSFSYKPLRLCLIMGTFISFFAFLFGFYSLIAYFNGKTVPGWASLIISVMFLGGIQLLSIGLIGEYVASLFSESKKRPLYLIKNEINM